MDEAPPPRPKPQRRKRRLLRVIGWTAGAMAGLWLLAFALTSWQLNQASRGLRVRGRPATYDDVVARMHAAAPDQTGVELFRQAGAEHERIGLPGDQYFLRFGKYDLDADEAQQAFLAETARNSRAIRQLLEQAVAKPAGPFTRPGTVTECWHRRAEGDIQKLRPLARLLWPLLKEAARRGDHDDVVRLLALSFRLSESLSAEPFLMSQLVRIAMLSIANGHALALLPSLTLSAEQFRALDDLLAAIDRNLTFEAALVNERAAVAAVFEDPAALKDHMTATQHQMPSAVLIQWRPAIAVVAQKSWMALVCSPVGLPGRRRAATQCLRVPDDVLALVDRPTPWPSEVQERYDRWKSALNNERLTLTAIESSSIDALVYAARRIHRRMAMTRLALRLKWFDQRHGRLPERLDEVCDAAMPEPPLTWFESKPFAYPKSGRAFRIEADPSVTEQRDANLLSREDIRVIWGLLVKMDFSPPPTKGR